MNPRKLRNLKVAATKLLKNGTLDIFANKSNYHTFVNRSQESPMGVGLNVLPKTAYICEYSERITHTDTLKFMHLWLKKLRGNNILDGGPINLDFQSLPYFGEDDVVEKHYVSMRSRRQKAVLVFFAQDAKSKIFCYSNSDLRKGEEANRP